MSPQPKRIPYRNKQILNAAKGERCTIQCSENCATHDTTTTVAAHFNESWAGKGMGQKADDCAIIFACHECHLLIDSHTPISEHRLLRAYYLTIRRLLDKGVLK